MRKQDDRQLSLLLLAMLVLSPSAHAQEEDLEVAKGAWQRRHDLVRSIRVTFNEDEITHLAFHQVGSTITGGKQAIPDKDLIDSHQSVVTIKGDNFKYAYTGKLWTSLTRKQEPVDYIAISTPDVRSFFFNNGANSGQRPQLSLSRRANSDELLLKLVPLMLAVRSGQPSHRKLINYTLTGQTIAVEGHDCAELFSSPQKGKSEYMYLDPKRDWVVLRVDGYTDGKLTRRITVDYNTHPIVGWLPSRWSYVLRLSNGTALISGEMKATKSVLSGYMSNRDNCL